MRPFRDWVTAALAAGVVVFAGCDAPGERASTGECPEGESCSELTPDGLYFRGAPLVPFGIAVGIQTTAAGGHQTITVLWPKQGENEPVTEAFAAEADAPGAG